MYSTVIFCLILPFKNMKHVDQRINFLLGCSDLSLFRNNKSRQANEGFICFRVKTKVYL